MVHPSSSRHPYVEKVLVLNTTHLPSRNPPFGNLRAAPHKGGFVVFVPPYLSEVLNDRAVFHWLKPIVDTAIQNECTLILFDRDGNVDPELPEFSW